MIEIGEIDLAGPPGQLQPTQGEVWYLVRHGEQVLGEHRLKRVRPRDEGQIVKELWARFHGVIAARERTRSETGHRAADVSIVVCTKDRPAYLRDCLAALQQLDPPCGELIVVDNASTTGETASVAEEFGVTLVSEPEPGLDRARNAGWRAAKGPIVAYVDDDARVDSGFGAAIARAFAHPHVTAVTGLVLPAELGAYSQTAFEKLEGGMGKGFERRLFTADDVGLDPYILGVGTNMAYRRSTLNELNGFDVRLDVGTATRGGGDLEMFWRVLGSGGVVQYEPDAVVRHIHRRDRRGLINQFRDNGTAYRAFLEVARRSDPGLDRLVRKRIRKWHYNRHLLGILSAVRSRKLLVAQMAFSEWQGSRRGVAALDQESRRSCSR